MQADLCSDKRQRQFLFGVRVALGRGFDDGVVVDRAYNSVYRRVWAA